MAEPRTDGSGQECIRDFVPGADDAQVADLWQRVFGAARGGQSPEWLFRDGPAGVAPRAVAEIEGRIVAHAGAVPLRFALCGEAVRGGYSVGAMTDPACQGRGLFFRVGRHLYDRLEREGFAFIAGFSNRNSERLMTGPLGRTPVRPFPWCVKVLRPLGLVTSLLGLRAGDRPGSPSPLSPMLYRGIGVGPIAADDPRLDVLWRRAAPGFQVGAVRDAAHAKWRYGTRPDAGYRLLLATRDGNPAAALVFRTLPLRGIRAGFVLDLVVAEGETAAGAAVLAGAERLAADEDLALLSALQPGGGPSRKALLRAGFLRVPERLHPQLVRFSVRGLGRFAAHPALVDPAAWHLSWADTDVV